MKNPTKSEMQELISMFYQIEQVLSNFGHVIDCQKIINPSRIESARKKIEKQYDNI